MHKYLLFILFAGLLAGCVSTGDLVDDDVTRKLSNGNERISYHYPGERSALYDKIYEALLRDGFRIDQENEKRGHISTQGKDVGQSTMLRMQIFIEDDGENRSMANFRAQYKPGADAEMGAQAFSGLTVDADYEKAVWGNSGRPERAYAYMYKFVIGLFENTRRERIIHHRN